ncbi:MAG: NAD(+) synthase [Anaerolineae bacterium]
MRVALAQINPCIGDLAGNVECCLAAIEAAHREKAALIVLPEMAIPGCPPRDILFDSSFSEAVLEATADLAHRASEGPPVIVGTVMASGKRPPNHPGLYNAAVLLSCGEVKLAAAKRLLPAHDIFYEPRWFVTGPAQPPLSIADRHVGVLLGDDLRDEGHEIHPPADLLSAGADLLICLAASPYHHKVMAQRLDHARRPHSPLIYVNLCGGSDELIFDGRSFAIDPHGDVIAQLNGFEEDVQIVDLEENTPIESEEAIPEKEVYQALVLGVRDFFQKNQIERAFLGLSGGIDSALVATIAAEALGPSRVTAVAMPSRYTNPRSTTCARELARALGIGFETVGLEPLHAATEEALGDLIAGGTAAENVQARIRAMILMGFVNRYGGMLLNTSNKTELALGYGTVCGDTAGTLCPIADLTKPEVYALARWIESQRGVIPQYTLERPPSAELKPDQVDPFDYDEVGPAMERLVQENRSNSILRRTENKRWQMGVILKISEKSFGTGRMIPITRR